MYTVYKIKYIHTVNCIYIQHIYLYTAQVYECICRHNLYVLCALKLNTYKQ